MFARQIIEREFQKCEAQPAFLPGFIWEPAGDDLLGLRGFFSNPREGVSKVWSLTAFPAQRVKNLVPRGWSFISWYCQDGRQDAHFKHFGGLGSYIARMSFRRLIFSTLGAGPRHCQNDAQVVSLSILTAWRQILLEWVSGCFCFSRIWVALAQILPE